MEIKKVKSHFCCGNFDLIGVPVGYEFYPITYKEKLYIVTLKLALNDITVKQAEDIKVRCNIFEYSEKKKFFQGHRGNCIYKKEDISFIKIDEELAIDIRKLSEEEMKIYLPKIMKAIFEEYEKFVVQKEEKKKQIACAEQWDGKID